MSQSRTEKTLKNANIALVFSVLGIFIGFFSRKIFIDNLGAEILGLNTIASNLLGFLNIAELGIGVAISYSLYGPLFDGDRVKIEEIIIVQGYLYRKIAYLLFGASAVLMCFFPLIFAKSDLSLWYAYGTFSVLLCSSLFGYIWNYQQILLSADQKQYKITINQQLWFFLKVFLQIIFIKMFSNKGYICWIVLEFLFAIIRTLELNRIVYKEYPWLQVDLSKGIQLVKSHREIIKKTKQLFVHKIATFVLQQTSPLIMYGYTSLALVALYGNYMTLIAGLSSLFNSLFNSMGAGIGNLVAEGEKDRIVKVFWELFTLRFWITLSLSVPLFFLSSSFITLWLGIEYVLPNSIVFMIVVIFFIGATRGVVDGFIAAYGLYQDVWAPWVEASINIILSVMLGYFFGITGILVGVAISLVSIVLIWKPYFLYKKGLRLNSLAYFKEYIIHLLILVGTSALACQLIKFMPWDPSNSILDFIFTGLTLSLFCIVFSGIMFGLFTIGFRLVFNRIILLLDKYFNLLRFSSFSIRGKK